MNCTFKDIFGTPRQGVHKPRVFGTDTALIDYTLTIISAILISKLTKVPLVLTTILLFIFGELMHYMFCIPTRSLSYLQSFIG